MKTPEILPIRPPGPTLSMHFEYDIPGVGRVLAHLETRPIEEAEDGWFPIPGWPERAVMLRLYGPAGAFEPRSVQSAPLPSLALAGTAG